MKEAVYTHAEDVGPCSVQTEEQGLPVHCLLPEALHVIPVLHLHTLGPCKP